MGLVVVGDATVGWRGGGALEYGGGGSTIAPAPAERVLRCRGLEGTPSVLLEATDVSSCALLLRDVAARVRLFTEADNALVVDGRLVGFPMATLSSAALAEGEFPIKVQDKLCSGRLYPRAMSSGRGLTEFISLVIYAFEEKQ